MVKDFMIKEENGTKMFYRVYIGRGEYAMRLCFTRPGSRKVETYCDACSVKKLSRLKKLLEEMAESFETTKEWTKKRPSLTPEELAVRVERMQIQIDALTAARAYLDTIQEVK